MLEEAQKRDHRRLGKDLELFTLMEEGPGFPDVYKRQEIPHFSLASFSVI